MENTQDTPSGRTCRARFRAIRDGTSSKCCERSSAAAGGNNADVPEPARAGRADKLVWRNAGCILGDGYSIAWRVLDAQYWGVPQRRKRIFLVCRFWRTTRRRNTL